MTSRTAPAGLRSMQRKMASTAPAGFKKEESFSDVREKPKGAQVINLCSALGTTSWLSDHIAGRQWRRSQRLEREANRTQALSLDLIRDLGFPFFDQYNDAQVSAMVASTSIKTYLPGTTVVEQDDLGNELVLVFEGELEVLRSNVEEPLAILGPGQSFGEMALIEESFRRATVRCVNAATLGFLHRNDFQSACRHQKLIEDSRILSVISRSPPFNVCYLPTLIRLAQTSSHIYTDTGCEVAPRNELDGALVFILHGEVEVRANVEILNRQFLIEDKSKIKKGFSDMEMDLMRLTYFEGIPLMWLKKGQYWGHDRALEWNRDWVSGIEFSNFHVVATTPCRTLLVRPDAFQLLFRQDHSLKNLIGRKLKMEYHDVRDKMLQICLLLNKYDFATRSNAYLKQIHDLIREEHVSAQLWTWTRAVKEVIHSRESEERKRKANNKFDMRNKRVDERGMQNMMNKLRQKPQMSSSLPNLR